MKKYIDNYTMNANKYFENFMYIQTNKLIVILLNFYFDSILWMMRIYFKTLEILISEYFSLSMQCSLMKNNFQEFYSYKYIILRFFMYL